MYSPKFHFNPDTQNYEVLGPSAEAVAEDVLRSFRRDVESKTRTALIAMGWLPPEVVGEFKAAFRANMLRRAQPGEDIDAEIDRVFQNLKV